MKIKYKKTCQKWKTFSLHDVSFSYFFKNIFFFFSVIYHQCRCVYFSFNYLIQMKSNCVYDGDTSLKK